MSEKEYACKWCGHKEVKTTNHYGEAQSFRNGLENGHEFMAIPLRSPQVHSSVKDIKEASHA